VVAAGLAFRLGAWPCARGVFVVDLVGVLAGHASVAQLSERLEAGKRVVATGAGGSVVSLTAAAVARTTGRPVVLVLAHVDDADEALDELTSAGAAVLRLPALEALPGESHASLELLAERLSVVKAVVGLGGVGSREQIAG